MDSNPQKDDKRMFCFVDGCYTTSAVNKHLGFHKFPGSERKTITKINKNGNKRLVNRRQLWIDVLNIDKESTTVIGEMRVCSLHFSKKDFNILDKRRPFALLKNTAVPRRNLPLRKNSKLTTRLHFRNFNRIKWRGRLSFQDPDGRLPISRSKSLGDSFSHVQRKRRNSDFSPNKIDSKRLQRVQVSEGSLDGGKVELQAFSLADTTDTVTFLKDEEDTIADNEVDSSTTECKKTSMEQFTSEVIIKDEPLSDYEKETEDYSGDEVDEIMTYNDLKSNLKESALSRDEFDEEYDGEKDVKVSYRNGAVDSEEDEGMVMREEDMYDEEELDEDGKEVGWRNRPCKVCGENGCPGHPTKRPSENAFVCLVCSDIFDTQKQLAAHSRIHDAEIDGSAPVAQREYFYKQQKDLKCRVCGKVLATKLTLKEHMLIHTGEKPHNCLLCGRMFRHKANLVVHINAHTIIRTFECPMCPETFSMRVDLEEHKRSHSNEEFSCSQCSLSFHSKRALWTHQNVHTKRGQRRKRRGMRKGGLLCKICGKMLSTKNTLKEHMMIHSGEKPHECQFCGKTIRHKANFIIHVQSHNANERYHCDQCSSEFPRMKELRKHKMQAHSTNTYHCILCDDVFHSEEDLMFHVEKRHGDDPDWSQDDPEYTPMKARLLESLGRNSVHVK